MEYNYQILLAEIKATIQAERTKAARQITRSLIDAYWEIGSFKPEYAGKMNFHLELLDEQAKMPGENASIGIILCAEKENLEVEYALRTSTKPMGVAEYQLSPVLPEGLSGVLPSPEEIKRRIQG